jgi:hypothetical protein
MKKQALKTFTMLNLLLILTAVSASAQFQQSKVAKIPFSFIVGGRTLPAGEYTVKPNRRDHDDVWLVQSGDGHASALFTTMSVRSIEVQEKSKLVFHKYGDRYFLSQIWSLGDSSGRELLMHRLERELAKNRIERQTIVLADGPVGRN